jgi:hypothetical protein
MPAPKLKPDEDQVQASLDTLEAGIADLRVQVQHLTESVGEGFAMLQAKLDSILDK